MCTAHRGAHCPGLHHRKGTEHRRSISPDQRSPVLAPGAGFLGDDFSLDWGAGDGDGLGKIQTHDSYCALYFYYGISSTSDHQAFDPGV